MKILIFVLGLCFIGTANAVSMCLPSVGSYVYTKTDSTEGNRGYFANGGACTKDDTTKTITCAATPTIRGESHCSVSGIYNAANWESGVNIAGAD